MTFDLMNGINKDITRNRERSKILLGITLLAVIAVFLIRPIAQDPAFHNFADGRSILGIANFWNVMSNVPFFIIGVLGMILPLVKKPQAMFAELRINYFMFFLGIFLTGIGSSYYHSNPNSDTLVWDRLPMTIAFMSFFAIIIGEYISVRKGRIFLFPLIGTGFLSIGWWVISADAGMDDLRFYMLVQFLPMLLIPLMLFMFPKKFSTNLFVWLVMLAYVIAKVFEAFDYSVYSSLQFISGHSIKHLFAAAAPAVLLWGLYKRKSI